MNGRTTLDETFFAFFYILVIEAKGIKGRKESTFLHSPLAYLFSQLLKCRKTQKNV